jgi:glutaminase
MKTNDRDIVTMNKENLEFILEKAVERAIPNKDGMVADYIPELGTVKPDLLAASVMLADGTLVACGPNKDFRFTLQSVSKLVLLIGLMEEFGSEHVFSWINAEPSGLPFAAIGDLDRYGPVPSNPLINAGAICLSGRIPGDTERQLRWVKKWVDTLFGADLEFSDAVYNSEFGSADRNRSLAYLMKSTGVLQGDVEEILKPYFSLCSYTADISQAVYLPTLLAKGGVAPNGKRIISEETSNQVIAIMATCGLYNESGMHLVKVGIPAKSGISGLIVGVGIGSGGIAAFSPRVNRKGTSVRGHMIISDIAQQLHWHFASPHKIS